MLCSFRLLEIHVQIFIMSPAFGQGKFVVCLVLSLYLYIPKNIVEMANMLFFFFFFFSFFFREILLVIFLETSGEKKKM